MPIRGLGLEVPFAAGETIHTESSYKFDPAQIAELAAGTGFELRPTWTDAEPPLRLAPAGREVAQGRPL